MATYPTTLAIGAGSRPIPRTGRQIDYSGDGLSRVRKLHADRTDFFVVHPALTSTERATLIAFLQARGSDNASFTFYWIDGQPYTVNLDEPPWEEEPLGAGLFTFRVNMKAAA